jgi:hypothetical protein
MRASLIAILLLPTMAFAAPPTGENVLATMQSTEKRVIGCKEAPEQLASWTKVCVAGANNLKPCTIDGDCPTGLCRRALVLSVGNIKDTTPYDILPNDCAIDATGTRLRCMVVPFGKNGKKYQIRQYAITVTGQLLACDRRVDISDVGPFKPQ